MKKEIIHLRWEVCSAALRINGKEKEKRKMDVILCHWPQSTKRTSVNLEVRLSFREEENTREKKNDNEQILSKKEKKCKEMHKYFLTDVYLRNIFFCYGRFPSFFLYSGHDLFQSRPYFGLSFFM